MDALTFQSNARSAVREYYEGVTLDALRTLWARRALIAASIAVTMLVATIGMAFTGARYTSEAVIRLTFAREEPSSGAKSQMLAVMDASSVVESTARLIRSRATMSAVVSRLGLDRQTRPETSAATPAPSASPANRSLANLLTNLLPGKRSAGGNRDEASDHDAAVAKLTGQMKVTNDLRSYLITIAVTASDPDRAALLANAIASEYLRAQALQQVGESYSAAEREMADLSAVYGPQHPAYVEGRAKLARIEQRLRTLAEGKLNDSGMAGFDVIGQTLLPAERVRIPSGPSTFLVLMIAAIAGAAIGAALAMIIDRRSRG